MNWGFIPFTATGAQLLFQLCSALYERVALIVTTNLRFADWSSVMGGMKRMSAALSGSTHASGNDPGICGNLVPLSPATAAARTGGSGSSRSGPNWRKQQILERRGDLVFSMREGTTRELRHVHRRFCQSDHWPWAVYHATRWCQGSRTPSLDTASQAWSWRQQASSRSKNSQFLALCDEQRATFLVHTNNLAQISLVQWHTFRL